MNKAISNKFILDIINSKNYFNNVNLNDYMNSTYLNQNLNNIDNFIKNYRTRNYIKSNYDKFYYGNFEDLYKYLNIITFPINFSNNETLFIYYYFKTFSSIEDVYNEFKKSKIINELLIIQNNLTITINNIDNDLSYLPYCIIKHYIQKFLIKKYTNLDIYLNDYNLSDNNLINPDINEINKYIEFLNYMEVCISFCIYHCILNLDSKVYSIDIETLKINLNNNIINKNFIENHFNTILICHFNIIIKIINIIISTIIISSINYSTIFGFIPQIYSSEKKTAILSYVFDNNETLINDDLIDTPFFIKEYYVKEKIKNYILTNFNIDIKNIYLKDAYNPIDVFNSIQKGLVSPINYIEFEINRDILIIIHSNYDNIGLFFELLYIDRNDLFIINKSMVGIKFKKNSFISYKLDFFIPLNIIPYDELDNLELINNDNFLKSFYKFYNIIDTNYQLLIEFYLNSYNKVYNINTLNIVKNASEIIIKNNDKNIEYIVNILNNNFESNPKRLFQLMYLFYRNSENKTLFNNSIENLNKYYLNELLLVYLFSKQYKKQLIDDKLIDRNYLLNKIEIDCIDYFNKLNIKEDLYKDEPFCSCLYYKNSNITPICFDNNCFNSPNDGLVIKDKYNKNNCSYSICTNGISVDNIIANSNINFLNFITNTNCSNYNIADDIIKGNYNIYLFDDDIKKNFIWKINKKTKFIETVLTNINNIDNEDYLFFIEIIKKNNKNLLRINNITFNNNNILIYDQNNYLNFNVSLIKSKLFLINEKDGIPLLKSENSNLITKFIPNINNDNIIININLTFIKN